MKRRSVQSPSAPGAIGAYSPAVHVIGAKELVFASGQIGLDPNTGELAEGGVEAQARCALRNLEATLQAAGCEMRDVVRATLYLVDMNDFAKVNAIYGSYFTGEAPARVAIGVASLPKGALFEVDAIAAK